MLVARAPVRVSFFGGGTDLPSYYEQYGGTVLSTAIDRYIYVILNARPGALLEVTSSDYRAYYRHRRGDELLGDGDLALPKTVLKRFGIEAGMSVFVASQVPPGTGLGSSSAVSVALCKALGTLTGRRLSKAEVAETACDVELGELQFPIGKQDQYASAFGGLNCITFSPDGVEVDPVRVDHETLIELQQNLLLFFTGAARHSGSILGQQRKSTEQRDEQVIQSLHQIKELVPRARAYLEHGQLREFGRLLDEAWQHKKRLAGGISNARIDEAYALARERGALGGKITGAGGGGFLMLYCEPRCQEAVTTGLDALGLARVDVHFDFTGAHVLMNATGELEADATLW